MTILTEASDMATSKKSTSSSIYQIKVTLKGTKPPVWRRFQVPSNLNLFQLHEILQTVMGWEDYHLFLFNIGGQEYRQPDLEFDSDLTDAKSVKLKHVYKGPNTKFVYVYDFGDNWEHEIRIEKEVPSESGTRYPICLTGKRACPPEDCGGVWGYADLLKVIQDPSHPEYEEMMEWLGGEFDPEEFELEEINDALEDF